MYSELKACVPLGQVATLLAFKVLLRKKWLAAAGVMLLHGPIIFAPGLDADWTEWLMVLAGAFLMVTGMLRFGLFTFVIWGFAGRIFGAFLTTDFSEWYGKSSLIALIVIGIVALIGFRLSLLGRPLWRDIRNPAEAGR